MLIENVLQELQTLLVLIMRFKKKKNQRILRTLRRSHVVSTYGVGSVYQFKNKYNSNSDSGIFNASRNRRVVSKCRRHYT